MIFLIINIIFFACNVVVAWFFLKMREDMIMRIQRAQMGIDELQNSVHHSDSVLSFIKEIDKTKR